MGTVKVFQRIMDVREKEKNQAQETYREAVGQFEEVASRLYQLLREKEVAEANYQTQLEKAIEVNALRSNQSYMERLQKKIDNVQVSVQKAREEMDLYHERLTEAHIEVKKISKMVDNKKASQLEKAKVEETKLMDELSMRQFMNSGIR